MDKVNFLIVGQGIAGSLLAHELMAAGKSVFVVNQEKEHTSSNKAAGLYNPITGRKMVKTWLADQLFPGLEDYYRSLETKYHLRCLHQKTIYRPFFTIEEQNEWEGRVSSTDYARYVNRIRSTSIGIESLDDPYGGLELNFSGYVDLPTLLRGIRIFLKARGLYLNEVFQHEHMTVQQHSVTYRNIEAEKVIFCDGPEAIDNPYWRHLPFRLVKGEIMEIETNLPEDIIINRGVFIIPKNGLFSVGSTYDHQHLDFIPSKQGINSLVERLKKVYKGKCKIIRESAGIRPATYDRRPFIGLHPKHPSIGIFNGFGTKGVSLVPYCTGLLIKHLLFGYDLPEEVDIKRVNLSEHK